MVSHFSLGSSFRMQILNLLIILTLVYQNLSISTIWANNDPEANVLPFYAEKDTRLISDICSAELDDEDCINRRKNEENSSSLKNFLYRFIGHQPKDLSNKRVGTSLDQSLSGQCHCGVTFEMKDLGRNYHPRFIYTGVCKKNICGIFHKCQPRKYTLNLLKKRNSLSDSMDNAETQEILPESLQENWVSEQMKIVVGCECAPKRST